MIVRQQFVDLDAVVFRSAGQCGDEHCQWLVATTNQSGMAFSGSVTPFCGWSAITHSFTIFASFPGWFPFTSVILWFCSLYFSLVTQPSMSLFHNDVQQDFLLENKINCSPFSPKNKSNHLTGVNLYVLQFIHFE